MELITTTDALRHACERLAQNDHIAIDTEFMREATYWSKLCLIQLAGPDKVPVVVDALADDLSLDPLMELLANEQVVKVFHAARQDIEIFFNIAGRTPSPIFDTQVAASVCGYGEQIAYDQLVRRTSGAEIDKSHRFTDWSRRPLSEKQLRYAAADVEHLIDVYSAVSERIGELNREDWIGDEIRFLSAHETYQQEPEQAWTRLKMRVRKPRELAAMQALAAWRERQAQQRDVPRNRIVKDDLIYDVAGQLPRDTAALGQLRSVPRGFEKSNHGQAIVEIVGQVLALDKDELPKMPPRPRNNGHTGAVTDLLKVLLKSVAEEHNVATRMIASVDDIEAIAGDDEADVAALKGWRRKIFGDHALALKHGKLALSIDNQRVKVSER